MSATDASAGPNWQTLYDEAACGLMSTDGDGTIRLVNRTFCAWLGMGREALLGGRRFQDLLTMGGRIFHHTHWQPLLQLQGSIAEVKLDLVHADGHSIPMVMNVIRRERDGHASHEISLFIAKDRHAYERELMLARKRAEELLAQQTESQRALALAETRLRIALESSKLYVWELDLETGERAYDDRVALLLGLDAAEPVAAGRYAEAIEAADRERVEDVFSRSARPSSDFYRCSYRLNGTDGTQRTIMATGSAVVDDGGARRIVGLLQDISELSHQRAAAEDRALFAEQMIGIVSHDLRNPLSTIKLGTIALEMSAPAASQVQLLGRIQRAVLRAQALIDDLLDFTRARIGSGIGVVLEPVQLQALMDAHVAELAAAYPGRRLVHRASGEGSCLADANRLYQLVANLVSNAMAYGSAQAPVTVTSSIDGDHFSLAVHNDGEPIAPALMPNLFQPMVRGDGADGASRSVGLGLYIVSEIARAHRGRVTLASSAADGTTFTATMARRLDS